MKHHTLAKKDKKCRVAKAVSLIELLVSTLIVGIAAAGISGALLLNNITSVREFNKVDNLNAARHAIERMGKDIRAARNVGDVYGNLILLYSVPPEVWGTEGSNQFPSAMDPYYGSGQTPAGGW